MVEKRSEVRLGSFLEILDLGGFDTTCGYVCSIFLFMVASNVDVHKGMTDCLQ